MQKYQCLNLHPCGMATYSTDSNLTLISSSVARRLSPHSQSVWPSDDRCHARGWPTPILGAPQHREGWELAGLASTNVTIVSRPCCLLSWTTGFLASKQKKATIFLNAQTRKFGTFYCPEYASQPSRTIPKELSLKTAAGAQQSFGYSLRLPCMCYSCYTCMCRYARPHMHVEAKRGCWLSCSLTVHLADLEQSLHLCLDLRWQQGHLSDPLVSAHHNARRACGQNCLFTSMLEIVI